MLKKSYKDCFVAAGIDQVNTELLKLKKKKIIINYLEHFNKILEIIKDTNFLEN